MIYAIRHNLGLSLIEARTSAVAIKKCRLFFGEHGAPYHLPKNQDQEVAWAQAMGAGILDI